MRDEVTLLRKGRAGPHCTLTTRQVVSVESSRTPICQAETCVEGATIVAQVTGNGPLWYVA